MKSVKLKYTYNGRKFVYNKGCTCCKITPSELEDYPYNSDDSYNSDDCNDDDYLYDSSADNCDDDSVFSMLHYYSDNDGDFNDYDSDDRCNYCYDSDDNRRNYGYDSDCYDNSALR